MFSVDIYILMVNVKEKMKIDIIYEYFVKSLYIIYWINYYFYWNFGVYLLLLFRVEVLKVVFLKYSLYIE